LKIHTVNARKYLNHQPQPVQEQLVPEQALQISINGQPYTITMRTPGDDEALVRGLLYTEGMVPNPHADLVLDHAQGTIFECANRINVRIPPDEIAKKDWGSLRSLVSNASCGVCGTREISELNLSTTQPRLTVDCPLKIYQVADTARIMQENQPIFAATGGCHGAAAFDIEGNLLSVFEDIGRHNAVDKVIGGLVLHNQLSQAQILHVSGRVSYEIVNKAYRAGIPFLLAVSAPSSLSIELAEMWGITLIGFCRENRATVYSNDENIYQQARPQGRTTCQKT